MDEMKIKEMGAVDMLSVANIYSIIEQPDEVREQLKALYLARLFELKAEKKLVDQVVKMFKAFDKADKELAEEYTRQNSKRNSEIKLSFDGRGMPLATIENFIEILRNDDQFTSLKFNQLTYSPEHTVNGRVEKWLDKDDSITRDYIESKYHLYNKDKLKDALRILFAEREYHPIKDKLADVEWDGVHRITNLFIKWLKCEDTLYTREVTRLVFAGGIHRLYNPGCKFDDVCVFIGTKQGEGKSSFVRWLALNDDWFTDIADIEGRAGVEGLEGAWICEIAELLAVTKAKEVEAVKAYITKQVDKYRVPYDVHPEDRKRQCIFVGTTNKDMFLSDATGNRRWYPLKVNCSGYELYDNQEAIKHDILQAWAEAKYIFEQGQLQPYADRTLIQEIRNRQEMAVEDDYRVGMIEDYLENRTVTCILQLWKDALKNQFDKPTRKESNDIALILQKFPEWKRCDKAERFGDYGVQRVWRKMLPYDDEFPF